jgi:hypothetical protein
MEKVLMRENDTATAGQLYQTFYTIQFRNLESIEAEKTKLRADLLKVTADGRHIVKVDFNGDNEMIIEWYAENNPFPIAVLVGGALAGIFGVWLLSYAVKETYALTGFVNTTFSGLNQVLKTTIPIILIGTIGLVILMLVQKGRI